MPIARSTWFIVAGAIVLLVAGLAAFRIWSSQQAVQIEDVKRMRWRDLQATEAVLSVAPVPTGWLGGVFVSNVAIEKLLKLQAGTKIEVLGQEGFEDLTVLVSNFSLEAQDGPAKVSFDLLASSPKNDLSLALRATGELAYSETKLMGEKKLPHVFLRLVVSELRPKLTWKGATFALPDFLGSANAKLLVSQIGEKLQVPVPLSENLQLSLGDPPSANRPPTVTKAQTIDVKDTGGSVTLGLTYQNTDVVYPLHFSVPLFTKHGIWLLADDKAIVLPAPAEAAPDDAQISSLEKKVNKMRAGIRSSGQDVAVFLSQRALTSVVGKFGALTADQLTIKVASTASSGDLFRKEWRDDILGQGGFKIYGQGPNFVQGSVVISPPSATWVPAKGVDFTAGAAVKGSLGLHWHFDPLVGGGVGANLNVGISGAIPVRGSLGLVLEELGGQPVAMFVPKVECVNIPLRGEENGELHVKVRKGQLLFDKPLSPFPVLDGAPRRIDFPPSVDNEPDKKKVRTFVHWARPALDATLRPVSAKALEEGFWIDSEIDAAVAPKEVSKAKEMKAALAEDLRAYTDKLPPPSCPKADSLEVEILNIKIGENGELIKLFKAGGALVGKASKEVEEILKSAGKAAESVGRAAVKVICLGLC